VVPAWDNTARRQDKATVFVGSSPEIFEHWVARMVTDTVEKFRGEDRLLFVNAWNEWGEGCHLEPDVRYGRQYLQALRNATTSQRATATTVGVAFPTAETPTALATEHERR
jgi:lipopolysaccharide biosynthesis protein